MNWEFPKKKILKRLLEYKGNPESSTNISPTANSKSLRPASSEDGEAMKCQAVAMKIGEKATCYQGMDSSKGSSKKNSGIHIFFKKMYI